MPKFANNADFQANQAINMAAEILAAAPGSAVLGRIYYDSTAGALKVCTNATGPVFTTLGSGPSFATPAIALGSAAAAGAAGTVIRSDSTIAAFDTNAPTASAVGDAASVGSAAFAARRDHTHGREAFGAVTAATTFGTASANGSATTLARADHNHGTPTHVHADHNAIVLNDLAAATGAYSMGTHQINNVSDPTSAQDAATKNYVDSTAQGLSPKNSARCATTGAETYTIAAGSVTQISGTTVDGVSPAINDYILVKDAPSASGAGSANSTQPGNGLYIVTNATTNLTLSRAADMNAATEVPGAFVFVEGGTANATTGWVVSAPSTATGFTLGTNNIHWTQFSGAGTYTAGTGLTLTGSQFSVSATYVGQTSITTLGTITTGTWTGTAIAVANGGTGQTSAANARGTSGLGAQTAPSGAGTNGTVSLSAQGIPTKVIATIGDGAATSIVVTHNLNTTDVVVSCYAAATPFQEVIPDVQHTSANSVTLIFATAPSASQYKCAIVG